jgi:hypothetical protein
MEGIYAQADLLKVYKAILDATQEIAIYLRYHSGKYETRKGRSNRGEMPARVVCRCSQ